MGITTSSWKHHGSGNWSQGANWSDGAPSGGEDDALLLSQASPYIVTDDQQGVSLDALQVGAGVTLAVAADLVVSTLVPFGRSVVDASGAIHVDAGRSFTLGNVGTSAILAGAGTISLAGATSSGAGGKLILNGANVDILGGGKIPLAAGSEITSTVQAEISNRDDTISGAGLIDGAQLFLDNGHGGVIDANSATGATLTIDITSKQSGQSPEPFTNEGLVETTGGGSLLIETSLFNAGALVAGGSGFLKLANAGVIGSGLIEVKSGATIQLQDGDLVSDNLIIQAHGKVTTTASDATDLLSGVISNAGNILVAAGSELILAGEIDDQTGGALTLEGTGTSTEVALGGSFTLSGGVLQLGSGKVEGNEIITAFGVAVNFENEGVIQGAGQIGDGLLRLYNETAGVVNANGSAALSILDIGGKQGQDNDYNAGLIETTGTGGLVLVGEFVNAGTVAAKGAGLLQIGGTLENLGGSVSIAAKATLELDALGAIVGVGGSRVTIAAGGTLETAAGDAFNEAASLANDVLNAGVIDVTAATFLFGGGHWTNKGTVDIGQSGFSGGELLVAKIADDDLVLSGGGMVVMASALSEIAGSDAVSRLNNIDNTITGAGLIGTGLDFDLVNGPQGAIVALGGNLEIDTSPFDQANNIAFFHNFGLVEATAGATLVISQRMDNEGRLVAQTGATVAASGFVSGRGVIDIIGTGSMELGGGTDDAIDFSGSGGTLIEDAFVNGESVSGFAKTDTIDLRGLGFKLGEQTPLFTPLKVSDPSFGGVLQIFGFTAGNVATSESFFLLGSYANAVFHVAGDSQTVGPNKGTLLTIS